MEMQFEEQGGVHIVRLTGELTSDDGGRFVNRLTDLMVARPARILLDMSAVTYMNSSGLSELVRIAAQANIQEGRVVLSNLPPFIAGVLATTRLDRFFEVYPTYEEALTQLQ